MSPAKVAHPYRFIDKTQKTRWLELFFGKSAPLQFFLLPALIRGWFSVGFSSRRKLRNVSPILCTKFVSTAVAFIYPPELCWEPVIWGKTVGKSVLHVFRLCVWWKPAALAAYVWCQKWVIRGHEIKNCAHVVKMHGIRVTRDREGAKLPVAPVKW